MITIFAKIIEEKPPDVVRKMWNQWCRESLQLVGEFWHRTYLKSHFRKDAKTRYGYESRSPKYMRRKERAGKGSTDLVYSGTMQQLMQTAAQVKATPSRVRVKMVGPRYVTMNPFLGDRTKDYNYGSFMVINRRAGQQPDKKKEVLSVTKEEQRVMTVQLKNHMAERLNKFRFVKVTSPE